MKEKDITEKKLLSYNDVFADVINGTIFEGQEIVRSEDLTDANPVTQFKDDKNTHREQIRDVAKLWEKKGVIFSFIGIENQTSLDRDMILRVISYDGATYKNQIGNEHIYPVFTIVIYWGKNEWKVPTTLKERIECPTEIIDVVSDYKFKLIDMARLSDEEIDKFRDDFKFIAGILSKKRNYRPHDLDIKHPEEVLDLLDAVLHDDRFKIMKSEIVRIKTEGREVDMCEFLDELEKRGMEKGIEQGIEQGMEKGEEQATFRIAKNFKDSKVDIEIIVKATGLTKEQIEAL
jgi:hypothetical protein